MHESARGHENATLYVFIDIINLPSILHLSRGNLLTNFHSHTSRERGRTRRND